MTYAEETAHKAIDGARRCEFAAGGKHSEACRAAARAINAAIERCAQEADDAPGRSVAVAARIRALAASHALQLAPVHLAGLCDDFRCRPCAERKGLGATEPVQREHAESWRLLDDPGPAAPQLSVPAGPDLSPRGTALWNEVIAVVFDVSTQKLPTNFATAAIVRIFERHQGPVVCSHPSRDEKNVCHTCGGDATPQLSVPAEPPPTKTCCCYHAPEQHDCRGCTVESLMDGPCLCEYDGRSPTSPSTGASVPAEPRACTCSLGQHCNLHLRR